MKTIIMLLIATCTTFAAFSQTDKSKTATSKTTTHQAKYTCPMHPEVVSNKPGKCSECGMSLVKAKSYTCPMHPEVVSDQPGKCPKCEMDLTEVKTKAKTKKS